MKQRLPEVHNDYSSTGDSDVSNAISRLLQCSTLKDGVDERSNSNKNSRSSLGVSLPCQKSELALDGSGVKERHISVQIFPTPGFVVKSLSSSLQRKIFINVCSNDTICQPQMKVRLDDEGNEVEGLNVPIAVGPTRICRDHAGATSIAVDCVVHPSVIHKVELDSKGDYRDFICQLVIRCVEQKFPDVASIDTKYKLPRLKYQGYIDSRTREVVPQNHSHAVVVGQWVRDIRSQPKIEEVRQVPQCVASNSADNRFNCLPKIPMELYVELQDKAIHPILDFLQQRFTLMEKEDKASPHDYFTPRSVLSRFPVNSEEKLYQSQLFLEPIIAEPPMDIEGIMIHIHLTGDAVASAQIQLSAGTCKVSANGFVTTSCVMPFWISPKSAICSDGNSKSGGMLTVRANICRKSLIYDTPDPGSWPWMLAEALGSGNNRNSVSDSCENFIRPLMPPQDAKYSYGQETLEESIDEKVQFAEDKFHANDAESQYMLELQSKGKDKNTGDMKHMYINQDIQKQDEDTKSRYIENTITRDFTTSCPLLESAFPNAFGNDFWSRLLLDYKI
jgi:hypothetical protein